jgi:DNA-binding NarL/FixJ family response regulator
MTVLIADDSRTVAERLTTLFSKVRGVEIVGHAGTFPEALRAVQSLRPNVVTLDLQMSGGRGVEVLKTIKKGQAGPIVIVFTNHAYPQYRKKCLENGAHSFFDKSTEFAKAATVLKELVSYTSQQSSGAREQITKDWKRSREHTLVNQITEKGEEMKLCCNLPDRSEALAAVGGVRTPLVATGIICSTIVVPVLAIVLCVWFVSSLLQGHLGPWWSWAAGIAMILLLHVLARGLIRLAEKLENSPS